MARGALVTGKSGWDCRLRMGIREMSSKSRIGKKRGKSEGPHVIAAAARLRLIVWCRDCRYQVEPDPAEMAERYGPRLPFRIGLSGS
jgi:hypothetical protein